MEKKRTTPEFITSLQPNEIFVFGSNLRGMHAGGAAYVAYRNFGAIMGQGIGLQGQRYAIPTRKSHRSSRKHTSSITSYFLLVGSDMKTNVLLGALLQLVAYS